MLDRREDTRCSPRTYARMNNEFVPPNDLLFFLLYATLYAV